MLALPRSGRRPAVARAARLALTTFLLAAPVELASAAPAEAGDAPDLAAASRAAPPSELVVRVEVANAGALARLEAAVDVWSHQAVDGEVLARVTRSQLAALRAAGFRARVDAARTREHERQQAAKGQPLPGQKAGIPGFPCYRTVEETFRDLERLAAENPRLATWTDIGDSWEKINGPGLGYDLFLLTLTNRERPGPKPPLLITASIHAREYATAELATRFAERLVGRYDVDPDVTWILDHHAVHIVPILNPDGRKRAEAGLLWRKNVNNAFCSGTEDRGIDLNRNNRFFWGGPGSSGAPCSQIFRGVDPTSEPEAQTLLATMRQVFEDQRGEPVGEPAPDTASGVYIDVHSFGRLILPPFDDPPAPNRQQLDALAHKMGFLTAHRACVGLLGPASGNTTDLAYGEFGVAAYTYELGTTFFQGCAFFEEILLERNIDGLLYAAKAARRPYQVSFGPDVVAPRLSAPAVRAGEPVTLTATVDDDRSRSNSPECRAPAASPLEVVFYTVDRPPWEERVGRVLGPPPGGFSEVTEAAVSGAVDTSGLAPGRHTLFVTAVDREGNVGVPSAVFLTVLDAQGKPVPAAEDPGEGAGSGPRPRPGVDREP